MQKRSIELEAEDFKNGIPEKLNLSKNDKEERVEMRAVLEHLAREKENSD